MSLIWKDISLSIQLRSENSNQNFKEPTPWYIILKLPKDTESLESSKKSDSSSQKRSSIRLAAMEARGSGILQVLKEKKVDQEFYTQKNYPSKIKEKLRDFQTNESWENLLQVVLNYQTPRRSLSFRNKKTVENNPKSYEKIKNNDKGSYTGKYKASSAIFLVQISTFLPMWFKRLMAKKVIINLCYGHTTHKDVMVTTRI